MGMGMSYPLNKNWKARVKGRRESKTLVHRYSDSRRRLTQADITAVFAAAERYRQEREGK